MSLTGTHADESLRKTVSAYKYLGFNRIEISYFPVGISEISILFIICGLKLIM